MRRSSSSGQLLSTAPKNSSGRFTEPMSCAREGGREGGREARVRRRLGGGAWLGGGARLVLNQERLADDAPHERRRRRRQRQQGQLLAQLRQQRAPARGAR